MEKKRSNSNKKLKAQPIDLLEQKPLIHATLEEFFPRDFFKKVTINMVSCFELKGEDDEEDVQANVKKQLLQEQTTKSLLS